MRRAVLFLAVLCVICVAATMAVAGRPKPPPNTGGGTIYYILDGIQEQGKVWRMDSNGANKAPVFGWPYPFASDPQPSFHLYGSQGDVRWFVAYELSGPLVLVRPPGTGEGDRIELDTGDVCMSMDHGDPVNWGLRWVPGDTAVSSPGLKLDQYGAVAECGIYQIPILFSADGVPAQAGPPELVVTCPYSISDSGEFLPNVQLHDWARDPATGGTAVVWNVWLESENRGALMLTNVADGTTTEIADWVGDPECSRDGCHVVFSTADGLETLDLETGERRVVVPFTVKGDFGIQAHLGHWSPTGSHLVYQKFQQRTTVQWSCSVVRVEASGANPTVLVPAEQNSWNHAIAWR